jgi:phosphatidylglycerophosphatase A
MTRLAHLLVTTFGLGHMRPASGTWGSLPPPAIAWGLILLGLGPVEAPILYHAILAIILLFFSWACVAYGGQAETKWGKKDPGQVVADETAGQCIPLIALPVVCQEPIKGMLCTGLAFIAFRVFDIVKLPPANQLQRLPAGWGILVDDLVAGVQALIVVQLVLRLAM